MANIYTNLASRDATYIPTEQKMPFQAYAAVGAHQQKRGDKLYEDMSALDLELKNYKGDDAITANVYKEFHNEMQQLSEGLNTGEIDTNAGLKKMYQIKAKKNAINAQGGIGFATSVRKEEFDAGTKALTTAAGTHAGKRDFFNAEHNVNAARTPFQMDENTGEFTHIDPYQAQTHIGIEDLEKRMSNNLLRLGTEIIEEGGYEIIAEGLTRGDKFDDIVNILHTQGKLKSKNKETIRDGLMGPMSEDNELRASMTDELAAEHYQRLKAEGRTDEDAMVKESRDYANSDQGLEDMNNRMFNIVDGYASIAARSDQSDDRYTPLSDSGAARRAAQKAAEDKIKEEVYWMDGIPSNVTYTPSQGYDIMSDDITSKNQNINDLQEKIGTGQFKDEDLNLLDKEIRERDALVSNIRKQHDVFKYKTDAQGNRIGTTKNYEDARAIAAEAVADHLNTSYDEEIYDANKLLNGNDKQQKMVDNMVDILLEFPEAELDNGIINNLISAFPSDAPIDDVDTFLAIKAAAAGSVKDLFMASTKAVPDVVTTLDDSWRNVKTGDDLPSPIKAYEEEMAHMVNKEPAGWAVTGANGKTFNIVKEELAEKIGMPMRFEGENPNFLFEVHAIERELGEPLQFKAVIKPNSKYKPGENEAQAFEEAKVSLGLLASGKGSGIKNELEYVISPANGKTGLIAESTFLTKIEGMLPYVKDNAAKKYIREQVDFTRATKAVGDVFKPAISVDYHDAWNYEGETHDDKGKDISGDMVSTPMFLKSSTKVINKGTPEETTEELKWFIRKGKDNKSDRGGRQDNYEIVVENEDGTIDVKGTGNQSIKDAMVDLYRSGK
jgi:hypothetical protein